VVPRGKDIIFREVLGCDLPIGIQHVTILYVTLLPNRASVLLCWIVQPPSFGLSITLLSLYSGPYAWAIRSIQLIERLAQNHAMLQL
jgi:hypothetical protein